MNKMTALPAKINIAGKLKLFWLIVQLTVGHQEIGHECASDTYNITSYRSYHPYRRQSAWARGCR